MSRDVECGAVLGIWAAYKSSACWGQGGGTGQGRARASSKKAGVGWAGHSTAFTVDNVARLGPSEAKLQGGQLAKEMREVESRNETGRGSKLSPGTVQLLASMGTWCSIPSGASWSLCEHAFSIDPAGG